MIELKTLTDLWANLKHTMAHDIPQTVTDDDEDILKILKELKDKREAIIQTGDSGENMNTMKGNKCSCRVSGSSNVETFMNYEPLRQTITEQTAA